MEKLNVLYIGVDNPISIGMQGVAQTDIIITPQNCTLVATNRPGHYLVRVKTENGFKATLSVSYVDNGSGDTINGAGVYDFRIKKIPDPVTYIHNVRGEGVVLKENLQTITGIFTRMENFDFDGSFRPQSFSMSVIEDGEWKEYTATGPSLTSEMKAALTKCEEEDKVLFHNVKTKGPDSIVRVVNPVFITVK